MSIHQPSGLNLGIFSLRTSEDSSDLPVGSFWKRQQVDRSTKKRKNTNDSSESAQDDENPSRSRKRIANQTSGYDRLFGHLKGSTALRSESIDSDALTSTSHPTDDGIDNISSSGLQPSRNNLSEDLTQESGVDATQNLYINTQPSVSSNREAEDTHESMVINVNPANYGSSQDDSTTSVDRSNLGGFAQFTCNTENIPQARRKKVYPKQLPYDRIMSHVTFVMSGYENPRRGKLRDMAIAMGAKYQPNWTRFSTHLICAFKNTPKYKDVMAEGGRIVREHWIQECSSQRQLLDWRNYKLGKYPYPDSEEDVDVDDLDYVLETGYGLKRPAI